MAAINAISGIQQAMPTLQSMQASSATQSEKTGGTSKFAEIMKTYVDNVDDQQKASHGAMKDLLSGKTNDLLPVVNEVAKADLSFKLLMGVRNQVIDAYKQTMQMQI